MGVMIAKEQTRRIYALGAVTGLLESGNKYDAMHAFVKNLTGKASVTSLSGDEAVTVIGALERMPRNRKGNQGKMRDQAPGKMTFGQQKKAWALMYDLIAMDQEPSRATPMERMAGAIHKSVGVDVPGGDGAFVKNPFAWLSYGQGNVLIESLKGYVKTAKKGTP